MKKNDSIEVFVSSFPKPIRSDQMPWIFRDDDYKREKMKRRWKQLVHTEFEQNYVE